MMQMQINPEPSEAVPLKKWVAKNFIVIGFLTIILMFGGVGAWASIAKISGAIIASAELRIKSKAKIVQHPDGGVVGEIFVEEGQFVDVGEALLNLDETETRAGEKILRAQLRGALARQARLLAERDGAPEILFDAELIEDAKEDPAIQKMMDGQKSLFEARNETVAQESKRLAESVQQIEDEIEGTKAQIDAQKRQLSLILKELASQRALHKKGRAPITRVLSLEREEARLSGETGQLISLVASARGRISETEIEILRLSAQRREAAITELREVEPLISENRERLIAIDKTLSRTTLRAPVAGVVLNLNIHTIGGVIKPADPLMQIVPQGAELVMEAQIQTNQVDQVSLGQPTRIRFPAFNQRTTPEVNGSVIHISADRMQDQQGASFYMVQITLDEGEVDRLGSQVLTPGMPAEIFIETDERTPLSFLLKPLTDNFSKAFREE